MVCGLNFLSPNRPDYVQDHRFRLAHNCRNVGSMGRRQFNVIECAIKLWLKLQQLAEKSFRKRLLERLIIGITTTPALVSPDSNQS